jgi:two-component system, NtrC family, sensor histidine kinase HydH
MLTVVAAVSALHYATPPEHFVLHAIYQRSYYVPVILTAYWYGVRGGAAPGQVR